MTRDRAPTGGDRPGLGASSTGADLRSVQDAMSLSAHVVARDPTQMAGQMTGRLGSGTSPAIDLLLERANTWSEVATLCPVFASLAAPGGSLLTTLTGHDAEVLAVTLSADGTRMLSGAKDGSLVAWDLSTGVPLWGIHAHDGPVTSLVVHPDGGRVVSASEDGTMRLWDLDHGRALRPSVTIPAPILSMALLPGGGVITVERGIVRRWDLSSGRQTLEFAGGPSIAPSPDGRTIAALSDGEITFHDAGTDLPVSSVRIDRAEGDEAAARFAAGLALTPDGRRAIVLEACLGGDAGRLEVVDRVWVWTLGTDRPPRCMESRGPLTGTIEMRPRSVVTTPDGGMAISGSSDHTVKLWDLDGPREPKALAGHAHEVVAVAVTPDGRRVVSASRDRTVKVWDLDRPMALEAAGPPHHGEVNAVAVTPDGLQAASVASDGTFVLWDAAGRRRPFALPGEMCWSVGVSTDGRRAFVGTHAGTIVVWDVERGEPVATIPGDGQPVMHLVVGRRSEAACAISMNGVVTSWADLESGGPAARFEAPKGMTPLFGMTATPDGKVALAGSPDGTVAAWHPGTTAPQRLGAHRGRVTTTALTEDGRRGVSGSADGTLRVWDVENATELRAWLGHAGSIIRVAISQDGDRILSCSKDSTFRIWEAATGRLVAEFTGESALLSCASTPDTGTCVVGEHSGRVHLLRLHAGPFVQQVAPPPPPIAASGTPGGREVPTPVEPGPADAPSRPQDAPGSLSSIRAEASEFERLEAADPANPGNARNLAVAYAKLARAYGDEGRFEHLIPYLVRSRDLLEGVQRSGVTLDDSDRALVDRLGRDLQLPLEGAAFPPDTLQDGQPVGPPLDGEGGPVRAVAVAQDGRALSGSEDGGVRIWDLERGSLLGTLEGHRGPVMSLATLPDGRLLSGSMDETLRLWDLERGVEQATLDGHRGAVMSIAVGPDGSQALSASFDQTLMLWDLNGRAAIARMAGHFDAARSVRIPPDGRRAVASFYDGTVRIWDLVWRAEVATLIGHSGPVGALALTVDGLGAVSASDDGTLRLWDLRLPP